MKKKLLLFFATAMLSIMGAKADVIPSSYYSEPVAGTFYLYNVTQNKFLCGTGDPSLVSTPTNQVTLTALTGDDAGKYSIQFVGGKYLKMGFWGSRYLWGNDWSETGFFKWTFSTAGTKTYKLNITATADADGKFTNGNTYYTNGESGMTETVDDANEWALITSDNYTAYLTSLDPVVINKTTIIEAKGDATSLITNATLDDAKGTGWTGGSATNCNTWRGGDRDYESRADNVTFSQTLSNMPAGTYKVVAAVRGDNGTTATAKLNGTAGTTITNGAFDTSRQQINLNGVQMPFNSIGGFNMSTNALGWQWATATYTLAADGDLTIAFDMTGAKWKGIDDVHLYYMSDGTNTYAVEYSDGINNDNHVVTCDLQTDDPNKIFRASSNIYTASGAITNNLRINSNGWINKLVLYDGYEVSIPSGSRSVNSTLYRNIAAGEFATICCPFEITGGADGTFYQPESLTNGILNFETVTTKNGGKAYLYKAASAVTALTHAGDHWLADNTTANGTGVQMVGTYTNIDAVPTDDYVLSGTNLYKVNSTVTLAPFRAYFTVEGTLEARIALSFDDETTGIKTLNHSLLNVNKYYDMQGRRVAQPTKGLYIVNGKKVMIK